jgi:hypothetical protein
MSRCIDEPRSEKQSGAFLNYEVLNMAKTFNDLSDAELGQLLRSRYDRLVEAHDMGLSEEHPADRWAQDTEVLHSHREARADDEGGLGPVEIQNKAKVRGMDNPPDFQGKPANPKLGKPAQDSALEGAEDDRIRLSGHHDIAGQLALASARRSNPARIRAVARAVPGYNRLK